MKFGVNYTPRQGWFHSWLDFDRGAVAEDMAAIAAIGADHVRIFPLWPLLQPNRTLIRSRGIDDVVAVVNAAHEAGMTTSIDVLQGHVSSFDFLPSWVVAWHKRNLFTDDTVVSGELALVSALANALRDVPGATGLSVGNEFIQFAAPRHPDPCVITPSQANHWLDRVLGCAREEWPGGIHTHSHDDDLWFDDEHPFTPGAAVNLGDVTTVHSWVFGRIGPRLGANAPELDLFARYLCELAAAWSPDPTRGVWLQEIGAPENYVDPSRADEFLTNTVDALMGVRGGGVSPNLEAITWWCSHDVSRDLADFPALEHSLGLIGQNGAPKPIGLAFAQAVERWRGTVATSVERPHVTLDVPSWRRPDTDARHGLFDRWMELALGGDVRSIHLDLSEQDEDHGRRAATPTGRPFLSTRDE